MRISIVITENLRGGSERLLVASAAWIKKISLAPSPIVKCRGSTSLTTTATKAAPVRTGGIATSTERHVDVLGD